MRLQLLTDMGMVACSVASLTPPAPDYLSVTLDGKVVGYLPSCVADKVVRRSVGWSRRTITLQAASGLPLCCAGHCIALKWAQLGANIHC